MTGEDIDRATHLGPPPDLHRHHQGLPQVIGEDLVLHHIAPDLHLDVVRTERGNREVIAATHRAGVDHVQDLILHLIAVEVAEEEEVEEEAGVDVDRDLAHRVQHILLLLLAVLVLGLPHRVEAILIVHVATTNQLIAKNH